MKGASCLLVGTLGLMLSLSATRAQDLPRPAALDPGNELRRATELRDRQRALETFRPGADANIEQAPQARTGPCFDIQDIRLEGVTVLPMAALETITARYEGRCLQGADIQEAMGQIDAAYAEAGFITSRVYIPPQNIGVGKLRLDVVEGRLEDTHLIDGDGQEITDPKRARLLGSALRARQGDVFQLRDFEQGLDQMNRLESVSAALQLAPGDGIGTSDVILQRAQQDRFRGVVLVDNSGQESTGENKLEVEIEWDDPLWLNDTMSFGMESTANSNALAASYEVPFGYWTFAYLGSYSEYLLALSDRVELFGRSNTHQLSLSRMLMRDAVSTTEMTGTLAATSQERFINGAGLTPNRLGKLSLGLRHIRQQGEARWVFDGTVTRGTELLDASRDPAGLRREDPHAQYWAATGGVLRAAPLGPSMLLQSDLRLQYAGVGLYGTEQMAIGSEYTVRGYRDTEGVGDRGAYLRNDLLIDGDAVAKLVFRDPAPWTRQIQASGFADLGAVQLVGEDGWQQAAGIGVRLGYATRRWNAALTLERGLIENNDFGAGDTVLRASLTAKLF